VRITETETTTTPSIATNHEEEEEEEAACVLKAEGTQPSKVGGAVERTTEREKNRRT